MTWGSTREFMAMGAIAQHFGRPGTPIDQAAAPRSAASAAPAASACTAPADSASLTIACSANRRRTADPD